MKRYIAITVMLLSAGPLMGQNFQFHYDFGENRDYVTTTLEMIKPDEYGATFWFIDMDYDYQHNEAHRSMSLSYLEIARYIVLPFSEKLSATAQYNDGIVMNFPLGPIWLFGVSYPVQIGQVVLNTDLLYRTAFDSDTPDFQFTTVWFESFFEDKITFAGYIDIWSQDEAGDAGKKLVFQGEPQLWYNIGEHLSLGSEVELSLNFIPGTTDLQVMPTLGLKWQF
ncbi:MAG: hypothetical protein MAGBODY4_00951 [Candidatus Marinimicrobia bacterium]|nr:hypothetical protein [Candidatus Neomarinimicrobiota bacterium]